MPALLSLQQTTLGLACLKTEWWWLLSEVAPTMPSKTQLVVEIMPKLNIKLIEINTHPGLALEAKRPVKTGLNRSCAVL